MAQRCSVKTVFLEISQNSQENTCARVSFLIKLQAACNFIKKETLAQVFSCEFYEISKNTFSYRTPPNTFVIFCCNGYSCVRKFPVKILCDEDVTCAFPRLYHLALFKNLFDFLRRSKSGFIRTYSD